MHVETKFLRLFHPVGLGADIDGWSVCWLGAWDKHRVLFVVMVKRVNEISRKASKRPHLKAGIILLLETCTLFHWRRGSRAMTMFLPDGCRWVQMLLPTSVKRLSKKARTFQKIYCVICWRFCSAAAIYSQPVGGKSMAPYERNRVLSDFHDGTINVVCAVEIFNEGVDVADVNIIVFQRVTHSRRIFIQQLGRGLRLAPGKDKVIVLDFVSDIRRLAAGLDLKNKLEEGERGRSGAVRVQLPHKVAFRRVGQDDPKTENFLRQWLEDVAAVEAAGEDTSILKFPPSLPGLRE